MGLVAAWKANSSTAEAQGISALNRQESGVSVGSNGWDYSGSSSDYTYISKANGSALEVAAPFTICFDITTGSTAASQQFLRCLETATRYSGYNLFTTSGSILEFMYSDSEGEASTDRRSWTHSGALATATNYKIVVTVSDTSGTNTGVQIYVNGSSGTEGTSGTGGAMTYAADGNWEWGRRLSSTANSSHTEHAYALFDHILDSTEIASWGSDPDAFIDSFISSGVTGTAAFTEGADTVSASGTVQQVITGTAAFTEAADTANASGNVVISGSATITEGADTVSASGNVSGGGVAGTAAFTEGADTANASGTVQQVISGTAAFTEAADTANALGNVVISGSATITEGADTIAASGAATSPVTGTVSITEGADTIEATDFDALEINGFYMIDGYTRQIIVVDSLLEAIEAASTRNEARANMQAWFAARRIDATAYKLNAPELKALEQLVN